MNTVKAFFTKKETYFGVLASIAFPVIFFIIWLTAYDGVFERTDQLKIALVNDDILIGEVISEQLAKNTALDIVTKKALEEAQVAMDVREFNMVIHIPETFSDSINEEGTAEINFYINQSTPTMAKQVMESAAQKITDEINQFIFADAQLKLAENIPLMLAGQSENPELVMEVASQVIHVIQENTKVQPIEAVITKTNHKESFASTMIPLLVVLASYIGAMLLSQHLQFTEEQIKQMHTRKSLFLARQVINLAVTTVISTLIIGLLSVFNVEPVLGMMTVWAFQFLLFFSFITLSQVFVIAFKNPGMIINIALVATQLVSSGAIVPREMLSSFYQKLGSLLPGTYGVNGSFSIIYGGGDLASDVISLLFITGITLAISIVIILLKTTLKRKQVDIKN